MLRFVLVWLSTSFLWFFNIASSQTVIPATPNDFQLYGSSRALLIAVIDYDDFDWDDLDPIEGKVIKLERFLSSRGFETNIILNPTSTQLRTELRNFLNSAPEDSRSIVYFAGHGQTYADDYGAISYIAPADAPYPEALRPESDAEKTEREQRFRSAALSTDDMEAMARRSRGRHTLFLLESCFSAGMFHSMSAPPADNRLRATKPPVEILETAIKPPAFQFITAGGARDKLRATNPFVDIVIEGLSGAADYYEKGYTTAQELGMYVKLMLHHYPDERYRASAASGWMGLPNEQWTGRGNMAFLVPQPVDQELEAGTTVEFDPINFDTVDPTQSVFDELLQPTALIVTEPASFQADDWNDGHVILAQHTAPDDRVDGQETESVEVDLRQLSQSLAIRRNDILGEYNIYERFSDVDVRYYRKALDQGTVAYALTEEGIPYVARPAQLNMLTTNALACHVDDYDLDVLKAIGVSLIRAGVELRLVKKFNVNEASKRNRIEIISVARAWNFPPLTEDDILGLDRCPVEFHRAG